MKEKGINEQKLDKEQEQRIATVTVAEMEKAGRKEDVQGLDCTVAARLSVPMPWLMRSLTRPGSKKWLPIENVNCQATSNKLERP